MTAMRRYLIVANRTLGGHHLITRIREALARGPCEFHVVVPVTDSSADDATASAQHRLDQQLARLAELDARARAS